MCSFWLVKKLANISTGYAHFNQRDVKRLVTLSRSTTISSSLAHMFSRFVALFVACNLHYYWKVAAAVHLVSVFGILIYCQLIDFGMALH